jgi:hypothetical protein
LTQRRPEHPAEQLFVAACYALIVTVVTVGSVSTFSDDLDNLRATMALWAALVPLCLACVIARAKRDRIRVLSRRR